jgi:hypothetical protein
MRYIYGAIAFIGVVCLVFVSLVALERVLDDRSRDGGVMNVCCARTLAGYAIAKMTERQLKRNDVDDAQ